jgi:pimeloyl-ACP methyl ester carboxylesterase
VYSRFASTLRLCVTLCVAASALTAATALLDGRKVHYSVQGKGPRTLVLVHGWTCDSTFWSANVPELAKRYRVINIDLPGHGESDPAPSYTMDAFGDAVIAVLDEVQVKRAVLVGHSMGGPVILAVARKRPEQVSALVAVDAAFSSPQTAARAQATGRSFLGPEAMAWREAIVRGMFSAATTRATRERILKVMLAVPPEVADGAIQGMRDPEFWREDQIRLPFLEIASGASRHIKLAGLRCRFPRAEMRRVRGTGHFLMMEKPQTFNRVLLTWLAAHR